MNWQPVEGGPRLNPRTAGISSGPPRLQDKDGWMVIIDGSLIV